jgi:hypothetical protein
MCPLTVVQVLFVSLSVNIIYYIYSYIKSWCWYWCKFLVQKIDFGFANSMFSVDFRPRHDPVFIVALILTLEPETLI